MRDDAVSNAASVLMMIATVIGVASAVFVHAIYGASGPVETIGLDPVRGSSDPLLRELAVANASTNLTYQSVSVVLDGEPVKYDNSDSGTGYCIAPKGGVCVDKSEWLPKEHIVQPGDRIRIHGAALGGRKVDILLDTKQAWEGLLPVA